MLAVHLDDLPTGLTQPMDLGSIQDVFGDSEEVIHRAFLPVSFNLFLLGAFRILAVRMNRSIDFAARFMTDVISLLLIILLSLISPRY
jgi:hypothetical protein